MENSWIAHLTSFLVLFIKWNKQIAAAIVITVLIKAKRVWKWLKWWLSISHLALYCPKVFALLPHALTHYQTLLTIDNFIGRLQIGYQIIDLRIFLQDLLLFFFLKCFLLELFDASLAHAHCLIVGKVCQRNLKIGASVAYCLLFGFKKVCLTVPHFLQWCCLFNKLKAPSQI